MSDLRARVAYLRGLAEGMGIGDDTREGRVLAGIIGVLGDIADSVEDVVEAQDELVEYVEDVDSDLSSLEAEVFGDAVADEDDEESLVTLCCPHCGEELGMEAGEATPTGTIAGACPRCGEPLDTHAPAGG